MKKDLINYISLSFIKFIDYTLENRDENYLNERSYTNDTNKEELLSSKKDLLKTVSSKTKIIKRDIIKEWAIIVNIDVDVYDIVPLVNFMTKRVLDLHFQTKESRTSLLKGMLSFKFETHDLTLSKTIEDEDIMSEFLRQLSSRFDENFIPIIIEQSNAIKQTFIQYFEGVLKNTANELKSLNNKLEHKVEEKTNELLYTLYTDKLTNISNINAFFRDIENCSNKNIALINIDGFKKINSIYGSDFTDEVLKTISKKINKEILTCGNYKLYRYHADWFIILELNENNSSIEHVYNKVAEVFENQSIKVKNENLFFSFTAGIAKSLDDPIKYAELAFFKAKENKSSYEIYNGSSEIVDEYKKYQHVLQTIKNAIDNDLVFPYFQLIRDNNNPNERKYESLMRIKGPMGEVFSPFIFLDIAKGAKLYGSLSKIMMRKSIEVFKDEDATFSINLEVEDVLNSHTMDYLYELIVKNGVEKKIILEITESEDIQDFREIVKIFKRFKHLGVKIAIDDFGTGYSNFSYLMEFDFDFIKIDGSLIKNINNDKNSFVITKLLVDFAKNLGKHIIAEFIDNEEVQKTIEELEIDFSQGYLFSEPSPQLIQ